MRQFLSGRKYRAKILPRRYIIPLLKRTPPSSLKGHERGVQKSIKLGLPYGSENDEQQNKEYKTVCGLITKFQLSK
jgi:hypothetical protein